MKLRGQRETVQVKKGIEGRALGDTDTEAVARREGPREGG